MGTVNKHVGTGTEWMYSYLYIASASITNLAVYLIIFQNAFMLKYVAYAYKYMAYTVCQRALKLINGWTNKHLVEKRVLLNKFYALFAYVMETSTENYRSDLINA